MKKNHRCHVFALALVMAISVLPVSAMAESPTVGVYQDLFKDKNGFFDNMKDRLGTFNGHFYDSSVKNTIKVSDYEKYILWNNEYYEALGLGSTSAHKKITEGKKEMEVPPYPVAGTPEEQADWNRLYSDITVAYALHEHDLRDAPWRFDNNYHWKNCQRCGRRAFLRWHSDHDNDGVCDLCSNPIHYYNITVKESAGGKITVSAPKGAMNDRIDVTVTPNAGYHLGEVRFFNHNEKHSQLTRWEDKAGSNYHFVILNWDIDVEADFVKG